VTVSGHDAGGGGDGPRPARGLARRDGPGPACDLRALLREIQGFLWGVRDHMAVDAKDVEIATMLASELDAALATPPHVDEEREVDIVFDAPPGPESGRFVEVESPPGVGIRLGEWIQRDDGWWVLRIRALLATERGAGEGV